MCVHVNMPKIFGVGFHAYQRTITVFVVKQSKIEVVPGVRLCFVTQKFSRISLPA